MVGERIKVQANRPFRWLKGCRLKALSDVTIVFPGSLVKDDEQIGSIIDVSDDAARIGFRYRAGHPKEIESIICKIESGTSICLSRSSEAIALHESDAPIDFVHIQ